MECKILRAIKKLQKTFLVKHATIIIIYNFKVGVDRLSAPILSILPIIDIGHFQNRFADNCYYYFFLFFLYFYLFIIMQTNILFTGDIIYWWINNTAEII